MYLKYHNDTSTKKGLGRFYTRKKNYNIFYKSTSSLIVSKRLLTLVFLVLVGVSFISSANADGQCTYNTTTVIENGQTISKKEIKICDEVEFIGGQQFFTDKMKETILLLSFIFILEQIGG